MSATADSVPRPAAAYIRVSTDDQIEYSPAAQIVEIKRFASREGYYLPDELIFSDEGISGRKTANREGFNRMIGLAKTKPRPFDVILVWKFSRFARNREDSIVYKSMLRRQCGIEVLSVSEPLGDDKMSVLIEALIEAMDEYYSINLAEEVRRGMTEKARRGGLQTTPSFGYGVADGKLVIKPEEAAHVRYIFEAFINGASLFGLAREMNNLGVRTHRGGMFENRTIEYIIRNPVYIGKLRWTPSGRIRRGNPQEDTIIAPAEHEPIIAEDIYQAANARMASVKALYRKHERPPQEYADWISGLIRCADCGRTMVHSSSGFYQCGGYAHGACKTSQHVPKRVLKELLLSTLARDAANPDIIYKTVRVTDDTLQRSEKAITELSRRLERLREAYLSGAETLEDYTTAKKTLEKSIAELEISIKKEREAPPNDALPALQKNISEVIKTLNDDGVSIADKNAAVKSVLASVIWSKRDKMLEVQYLVTL